MVHFCALLSIDFKVCRLVKERVSDHIRKMVWAPKAGSGKTKPPNALWCTLSWIMPLVTQNQQSTTYFCHSWNYELTLCANKQKLYEEWELLIIWLYLGVIYHYGAGHPLSKSPRHPTIAPMLRVVKGVKLSCHAMVNGPWCAHVLQRVNVWARAVLSDNWC